MWQNALEMKLVPTSTDDGSTLMKQKMFVQRLKETFDMRDYGGYNDDDRYRQDMENLKKPELMEWIPEGFRQTFVVICSNIR